MLDADLIAAVADQHANLDTPAGDCCFSANSLIAFANEIADIAVRQHLAVLGELPRFELTDAGMMASPHGAWIKCEDVLGDEAEPPYPNLTRTIQ